MNIQQPTTSEVADTYTLMYQKEDIDLPPPQYILNVFAAEELSSNSSYNSNKYKCAWLRSNVIRYYILSVGLCPDASSRAISIVLNHK